MLLGSRGPLGFKMELRPPNDTLVYKVFIKLFKKKMMHTAKYMHQILDIALPAFDELFEDVDVSGLIENKGILYIWEKKQS